MTRRTSLILLVVLTIVAVVRVASTHRVFNATLDEPVHLLGGWIWLGGEYNIDLGHPPLARAVCALPLRLAGLTEPAPGHDGDRGNDLLYGGDRYLKNLARARSGTLLFLIAAIAAVAALATRCFGRGVAVMATALFTSLPPVLAHAALITTDMAGAAALALALLALDRFLGSQTLRAAAWLGAAIGLGILSKFSFLLFFPAAAVALLAGRRFSRVRSPDRRKGLAWPIVAVMAGIITWAGYLFAFGRMGEVFHGASFFTEKAAPESLKPAARWFADHVPIPAPALPVGLAMLKNHDDEGHAAFLLGERSVHGWWHYFPVVFFFKTPLPFLALAVVGIALTLRRRIGAEHAFVPAVILLVAMTGSINIGVRHVLPMYASLAIVAGYGTIELWRWTVARPFARLALCALLAWLFVGTAAAHPDYLAYFNEAAGSHPERIAVDSNLDWGQDVLRLERAVHAWRIDRLHIQYSTSARLERHSIPAEALNGPSTGWIAVGETTLALDPERYAWLAGYEPVRRIGHSMRLYYIPPD
jgi:hypothetical protein